MKYLFSIKSKHIEANQRIRNHTRFLSILFATLFAIAFFGSCASSVSNYHFKDSNGALKEYDDFLIGLRSKTKLTSEELKASMTSWVELADTVSRFLERDSAYHTHNYLSQTFLGIHDSIRIEMYRLSSMQRRTLKDICIIKEACSSYKNDDEIKKEKVICEKFYAALDSTNILGTDQIKTLAVYRNFLSEVNQSGVVSTDQLMEVIKTEDVIFRTFLSHLDSYGDVPVDDITKLTNEMCRKIFQNAVAGRIDSKKALVLMSMRTNRRLILNAMTCIENSSTWHRLTEAQQNAYFWMIIQPYIAIDSFGMAVLTTSQRDQLLGMAETINKLYTTHKLKSSIHSLDEICDLILKLYIYSI